MMRYNVTILILALLLIASPCFADRLFTEVTGSRDSDDATWIEALAGYGKLFDSLGGTELELAGGINRYAENGDDESFDTARLRLLTPAENKWRLIVSCRLLDGDDWSPTLPAATYTNKLGNKWYVELSAERSLVDSLSAIRNHIDVDSYVASADYRVNDSWTLVGAFIDQEFGDDNRKVGGIARVIYSLQRWPGLNLQLKGRLLNADEDSPHYFSPETLLEGFLLLGYATPFADDNWVIKLLAGPGVQRIEPFSGETKTKDAYLGEVQLRGWFNDNTQLVSRIGCTSAQETSAAYSYCYGKMELGYVW